MDEDFPNIEWTDEREKNFLKMSELVVQFKEIEEEIDPITGEKNTPEYCPGCQ